MAAGRGSREEGQGREGKGRQRSHITGKASCAAVAAARLAVQPPEVSGKQRNLISVKACPPPPHQIATPTVAACVPGTPARHAH